LPAPVRIPIWRRNLLPPTPRSDDPYELPSNLTPALKRVRSKSKISSKAVPKASMFVSHLQRHSSAVLQSATVEGSWKKNQSTKESSNLDLAKKEIARLPVGSEVSCRGNELQNSEVSSQLTAIGHPTSLPPKKPRLSSMRMSFSDIRSVGKPVKVDPDLQIPSCSTPLRTPKLSVRNRGSSSLKRIPVEEGPQKIPVRIHQRSSSVGMGEAMLQDSMRNETKNISKLSLRMEKSQRSSSSSQTTMNKNAPKEENSPVEYLYSSKQLASFQLLLGEASEKASLSRIGKDPELSVMRTEERAVETPTQFPEQLNDFESARQHVPHREDSEASTSNGQNASFTNTSSVATITEGTSEDPCKCNGRADIEHIFNTTPAKITPGFFEEVKDGDEAASSIATETRQEILDVRDESTKNTNLSGYHKEDSTLCVCSVEASSSKQPCGSAAEHSTNRSSFRQPAIKTSTSDSSSVSTLNTTKSVRFENVRVYYFARTQGTSTVPKTGNVSVW
uniref:Breast cancer type 1 susceptibility protein homolog n=1 Tax=Haemonchus placei TaxID=6290 RepID=A0A158QLR2_HAEPC